MTDNELKAVRDTGAEFARANSQEIAVEILEWQDTSLLRNGKLRGLARLLKPLDPPNSLKIAENFGLRAALEIAAKPPKPAPAAEVAEWQSRYVGDPRQPGFWERSHNAGWAKRVYETCPNHTNEHGWEVRPLYASPVAPAAAAPTPQQIGDYLHSLDAIQREVVEREARALRPAAAQPDERAAFIKAVQSLAFLCRTESKRLDNETLAALDNVENHLVAMGASARDDEGELTAARASQGAKP